MFRYLIMLRYFIMLIDNVQIFDNYLRDVSIFRLECGKQPTTCLVNPPFSNVFLDI